MRRASAMVQTPSAWVRRMAVPTQQQAAGGDATARRAPAPRRLSALRLAAAATLACMVLVEAAPAAEDAAPIPTPGIEAIAPAAEEAAPAEEAPAKPKRTRRKKADAAAPAADAAEAAPPEAPAAEEAPAKPKRTRRKKADVPVVDVPSADLPPPQATEEAAVPGSGPDGAAPADEAAEGNEEAAAEATPRRGWWQRTFGA